MSKRLYRGSITYDFCFLVGVDEDPLETLKSNIQEVVTNEEPSRQSILGSNVHSMDKYHPWYDRVPYGDVDGMPCHYYTDESIRARRDVVAMVKSTLTDKEWDALMAHFKSSDS